MACVCGKPCSNKSGGPDPDDLTKMVVSPVWISAGVKSSTVADQRSSRRTLAARSTIARTLAVAQKPEMVAAGKVDVPGAYEGVERLGADRRLAARWLHG
jgi:hypothetical protein